MKSPSDRYQNVAALARALQPFAREDMRASVERITRIGRASLPDDPLPPVAEEVRDKRSSALEPTALGPPPMEEEELVVSAAASSRPWLLAASIMALAVFVIAWKVFASSPVSAMLRTLEVPSVPVPSEVAPEPSIAPPPSTASTVVETKRPAPSAPVKPRGPRVARPQASTAPAVSPRADDFGGRK
jgi:hypothetical protein